MKSLREYQTFLSVADMDEAAAAHIDRNNESLTETDRTLLRVILGHSCKIVGVSFLKMATLAQLVGISDRQARRIVKKLGELKMIEKIQTIRCKSGGYGSNILRILPFDHIQATQEDTAATADVISSVSYRQDCANTSETSDQVTVEQTEAFLFLKHNKSLHNRYADTAESIGSEALEGAIPNEIYAAIKPFFGASDLYRIYGVLLRAKASIDSNIMIEDWAHEFVRVFKSAIWRLKTGRIQSLDGYLFAAWQSTTAWIRRKMTNNKNPVFTGW
jgi:predicted transcriptional regulator